MLDSLISFYGIMTWFGGLFLISFSSFILTAARPLLLFFNQPPSFSPTSLDLNFSPRRSFLLHIEILKPLAVMRDRVGWFFFFGDVWWPIASGASSSDVYTTVEYNNHTRNTWAMSITAHSSRIWWGLGGGGHCFVNTSSSCIPSWLQLSGDGYNAKREKHLRGPLEELEVFFFFFFLFCCSSGLVEAVRRLCLQPSNSN